MTNFYPIGSILPYAGPIDKSDEGQLINQGFMPCDGRPLSKADAKYQALQTVLGGAFGADANSFYVPDCRGQFLRGVDGGSGCDPDAATRSAPRPDLASNGNAGDAVGSVQASATGRHSHTYTMHNDSHNCHRGSLIGPGVYWEGNEAAQTSSSTGGTESRPTNLYVFHVICFQ